MKRFLKDMYAAITLLLIGWGIWLMGLLEVWDRTTGMVGAPEQIWNSIGWKFRLLMIFMASVLVVCTYLIFAVWRTYRRTDRSAQ